MVTNSPRAIKALNQIYIDFIEILINTYYNTIFFFCQKDLINCLINFN